MTWTAPEPPADPEAPDTGDLRQILQGYLDHHRLTLLRSCAGLTAEQLATRSVPPSSLSLLGLVRHLTKVERRWFRERVAGEDVAPLFPGRDEDFDALDPGAAAMSIDDLRAEWARCDEAVAHLPLDTEFAHPDGPVSLASLYVHMIEEYAHHNGHADLLRETIDGYARS